VHIIHHTPAETAWWSYAVLGAAGVFETGSWYFGYKAFRAEQRGRGIVATIRRTKDPSAFAVLLEDSAALLGLLFAFVGISLSGWLGEPWIDGAFSVLIGLLLCGVAVVMVYESMGLLVGEGMEKSALAELEKIIRADPEVRRVDRLLTLYFGPDDVMLTIDLRLASDARVADVRRTIARIKQEIQRRYPQIRHVYLDTLSADA
jgi:divalent metal cation (Fe/Co/Zn/Cd) transporter